MGRAEAVLRRAQHPVVLVALAFEVEHRVHHVLEHARAGHRTVLGHVPDQEHRRPRALGVVEQCQGALAHLRHRARAALEVGARQGLDRVHHHRLGGHPGRGLEQRLEVGLAQDEQPLRGLPQSGRAHPHLLLALLAADVEHPAAVAREPHRQLEQQRALADPGVAADQDQRAPHDAAAEHPVQLAEAGAGAVQVPDLDAGERARSGRGGGTPRGPARARGAGVPAPLALLHRRLGRGVPGPAAGAAAEPARRLVTAGGAEEVLAGGLGH